MKDPYTIKLEDGQSVIIYHNNKVLIKKTSVECRSIFTAWDSFVGTADEIEAEIKRLGLIEVKSPKTIVPVAPVSRPAAKPAQTATPAPEAAPAGNIVTNTVSTVTNAVTNAVSSTWNTITSIFTNNNDQ
ncbi:hypothetical protein UFOVP144_55 [uncultured Caudovirales phage]|uniref:Uncharacterized protein n=1 Tax=uncultured Caudovirales phage TaxID=2100421 RepID=A0A6J7XRH3_9CAUD|nr:hypothetical protein UFOVP144_55 [uncultured Caudovirales phage]